MKKLLLIILFISVNGFSQSSIDSIKNNIYNLERRVNVLEGITPPPPVSTDTNFVYPAYKGVILNSLTEDIYPSPYSPIFQDGDKQSIQILKGGKSYLASSFDGYTGWSFVSNNASVDGGTTLLVNGILREAYHKWYDYQAYFYFAGSSDRKIFYDNSFLREPHGEDITFIYDNGIYKAYARMMTPPAVRTIGYMESATFVSGWSTLVEILKPDLSDGVKEFYSMSVVRGLNGYFGFLNVFDPSDQSMDIQLVFSVNGKDNWKRLNNRKPIITRLRGLKQLYACASVIGDKVKIATISSNFGHDEKDRNGRFYFAELYEISLTNLGKFQK